MTLVLVFKVINVVFILNKILFTLSTCKGVLLLKEDISQVTQSNPEFSVSLVIKLIIKD